MVQLWSRSIRPDDHEDINLYVCRKEHEKLSKLIISMLEDQSGNRRCLLVTGERGVGKSIAIRAILKEIKNERPNYIPICVNALGYKSTKDLLGGIAESISEIAFENFKFDEDLLLQSAHLKKIIDFDSIKDSDLQKEGLEIESRIGIDYGLLHFIRTSLGIGLRRFNESTFDQTLEKRIDDIDRIKLISKILSNIINFRQRQPVIFIDNLDQIQDKDIIQDFLRNITWFGSLPIIVTVRTEFVRENILRNLNSAFFLGPSDPSCLLSILKRRIERAQDGDILLNSEIKTIATNLAKITNNPWAFLRWLDYLCSSCEINPKNYIEQLHNYIFIFFGIHAKEVRFLARWYMRKEKGYVTKDELIELGLRVGLINIYIKQGILIQFDVTLPEEEQLLTISPQLHFFKLED